MTAADIAAAAQLACLLEASAAKPGNVSPGRRFDDLEYEDFLAAAAAIGEPLSGAAAQPLGKTIRLAVEATARWTRSNVNLGIILLLAPLTRGAMLIEGATVRGCEGATVPGFDGARVRRCEGAGFDGAGRADSDWLRNVRDAVRAMLAETTVDDAREVYAAIRLASPGGLGRVGDQDVAGEPDITLLEAMRLAVDRDGIAREYATGFEMTFGTGVPALEQARCDGLSWGDAVVETFLTLLSAASDTHIARRGGAALAADVSRRARAVLDAGGVRSDAGRKAIDELDRELRDPHHHGSPGTTADLTAATIFVYVVSGSSRTRT